MSWTDRQRRMLRAMGLVVWEGAAHGTGGEPQPLRPGAAGGMAVAPDRPPVPAPQRTRAAPSPPVEVPVPPAAMPAPAVDPGRAHRIASLGWPGLRDEVAACRSCGLCESRRQTVFGVGHERARWLVVGEAPGEQEDLQGEPFVGAAGQLLDAMLHALHLSRRAEGPEPPERRVYIANTLKCRPPRNRNPQPAEMLACEPFLQRQIELLQPRLILAMGRFAVQALLRSDEPVGRLRGRVHTYHGVPLIVTYHPAYLLRNLIDKSRAWDDLCLAAEVFERTEA